MTCLHFKDKSLESYASRKHLDNFMETNFGQQANMKKPPSTLIHTYKPLLMCYDGKELSEIGMDLI